MTYPGIENDKAALEVNPDLLAVEERRKEREAEYDKYVALDVIPWGNVAAFAKGDRVPISTVERLKWDELDPPLVATRTSAAGRAVLEETDSGTTAEKEAWAKADAEKAKRAADKSAGAETEGPKKATSAKAGSN
jgi:hypothetical protein